MTRSKEQEEAMAWAEDPSDCKGGNIKQFKVLADLVRELDAEVEMLRAERGNYADKDAIKVLAEQRDALLTDSEKLRHRVDAMEAQECPRAACKINRELSAENKKLLDRVAEQQKAVGLLKELIESGPYCNDDGECSFCSFAPNDSEDLDHLICHKETCEWRLAKEALAVLAKHDAEHGGGR